MKIHWRHLSFGCVGIGWRSMGLLLWLVCVAGVNRSAEAEDGGTNAGVGADMNATVEPGVNADVGVMEGVIRLGGEREVASTIIENSTDPDICGKLHSLEDLVVEEKSRGIAHVIVALTGVARSGAPAREPVEIVLNNEQCRFDPHASVAVVGDVVRATNSDAFLHNVHYYGTLEANLALPTQGASASRTLRRPGMIIVKCDVHGWMQAFIRVDDHPFHAVTDEHGRFRIANIPEGVYGVELWHERLGPMRRTIRIEPGKTATLDVEYSLGAP